MQKKIWVIWFAITVCTSFTIVHAQNTSRPSIEELEVQLESKTGIEKIQVLHRLSELTRYRDIETARNYIDEAYDLSVALQNDSLVAQSMYRIASIDIVEGKKIEAIDNLIEARHAFQELGLKRYETDVMQTLGAVYSDNGQYEEASELYFQALENSRDLKDQQAEIFALTRLGVIQNFLGKYRISQRFLHDAIHLARETGDWGNETIALAEAGYLEEQLGSIDKAVEYFQKAIDIFEEKDVKHAIPSLQFDIARLYKDEQKLNDALKIAREALELSESLDYQYLVIDGLGRIAGIYHEMGEDDKAIEALNKALSKADESGMQSRKFPLLNQLSRSYQTLGKNREAVSAAQEAYDLAIISKDWVSAEDALELMIESEKISGDFKNAVQHQEILLAVRDSIINEEQAKTIYEMEARFRVEEKEKEIELLKAENDKREIVQGTLISGLVLIVIIGLLVYRSQRLKIMTGKAELEVSRLKRKELEQDLEFKNKQLTTQSLNIVQKNELMAELKDKIGDLKQDGNAKELNNISNLVDYSFSLDEDWKQFRMHFEEVHSGFYHILRDRFPDLTPNEMKLSALVKLNLNIKEMAAILGISPDSVKTARHRLRKKLEINTEVNLTEFMIKLEKESLEVS